MRLTDEAAGKLVHSDPRVQAIRCMSCHRLRAHPTNSRIECGCGAINFVATVPHPNEIGLAKRLYKKELEAREFESKAVQEIIHGWQNNDFSG